MNNLLANLGFLLQLSGFFIFLVAIIATYLNEINEAISFFITASVFFIIGFPLNALSERKEISFRDSLILFFLTFLFLGLIGSIPYMYLNIFKTENLLEKTINSIFESVSGFTTTGFTFLKNSELSSSMIIYRATSQFIGGIGIVYLLLTFLYSSKHKISRIFSKLFFSETILEIKKNVIEILAFFIIVTIALSLAMYYFNNDIIKSFSLVLSGVATGGFSHYEIGELSIEEKTIIIFSMIFGSISIFILSKFKRELPIYILTIFICSFVLNINGIDIFDSIFHGVSIVSTTGYSYIDFTSLPQYSLLLFSIVMLIGGMAISTAGGMKIIRLINSKVCIWKIIKSFILEKNFEMNNNNGFISIAYLFLFLSLWIFISLIFSIYYSDKLNYSIFDAASAISTSGFSAGIINKNMSIELKIFLIFIMILARIEILPFFAILVCSKEVNKKALNKILAIEQ